MLGYLKLDHNRFLFCSPLTSFDAKSFMNGAGYVTNPTSLHPRHRGASGQEVYLGAAHTRCQFVYTMVRSIILPYLPYMLIVVMGHEIRQGYHKATPHWSDVATCKVSNWTRLCSGPATEARQYTPNLVCAHIRLRIRAKLWRRLYDSIPTLNFAHVTTEYRKGRVPKCSEQNYQSSSWRLLSLLK